MGTAREFLMPVNRLREILTREGLLFCISSSNTLCQGVAAVAKIVRSHGSAKTVGAIKCALIVDITERAKRVNTMRDSVKREMHAQSCEGGFE